MHRDVIGWDIGGAHIKSAHIDGAGAVKQVFLQACPLWKGLQELEKAVKIIVEKLPAEPKLHAITMTGELVDYFDSREEGVVEIVKAMQKLLGEQEIRVFAGSEGFLEPSRVDGELVDEIASANWLASAGYVAAKAGNALFIDVGSTTTDILAIADSTVRAKGMTDYQRLCSEELVYTGIVRTPVMAIARSAYFQGVEVGLMAEYFATMADVYRLTGELNEQHDQTESADGGAKTIPGSARRLARMIGCDFHSSDLLQWRQLAKNLRSQQLHIIQRACERQLSIGAFPEKPRIIGGGIGRFLVEQLAVQLGYPYMDFSDLVEQKISEPGLTVADCAPAVSVASLAIEFC